MRVLLALTFLLWHSADARHASERDALRPDPEEILREPPFVSGKTHIYEVTINTTSGIPGLTSQVAKSLIQADVSIRPETDSEYILKVEYVKVSESRSGVDSPSTFLPLRRSPELERDLTLPIRFTYEDGEVKAYTLGSSESLPSRSIKRAILRHLQLKRQPYNQKPQRPEDQPERYPVTYNVTEIDETGPYEAIYTVNVSPYPDYPSEGKVFNISKVVSYERYGYPSYYKHQNFASERYSARDKRNQDPVKSSKIIHHNLRLLHGETVIESIRAEENDVVAVYDQDVAVSIVSEYVLKEVSDRRIEESREQQIQFTELNIAPTEEELRREQPRGYEGVTKEHQFIHGILDNIRSSGLVLVAQRILEKVSESVMDAKIESSRGQEITDDVSRLQNVLSLLKKVHLDAVFRQIVDARVLRRSSEKEKIKRQIFLDVLPLSGTEESVKYIRHLIERKQLSVYEAKEVLEAIPSNIIKATKSILQDLMDLVELPHVRRYHVLHSVAYLTVASVIRQACIIPELSYDYSEEEYPRSSETDRQDYEPRRTRYPSEDNEKETPDEYPDSIREPPYSESYRQEERHFEKDYYPSASQRQQRDEVFRESEISVRNFLQRVNYHLKSARKLQEKIVYIQALARVGHKSSLEILKPYVYGVSEDTLEYTPGDVDFVKITTLYSLHHIVQYHPEETQEIVVPVYFNRTEAPRVRIAAFSVLLRSNPSLALLQHVAQDTYEEPSNEVGSYVYSALQSYGNASVPYLRTTAERIKQIISQVKKYDIGIQYSKSIIKTFFAELRNYGIEKVFEVVQNGESFIPSSLYSSLKYSIQALQDVLYQAGFNIQGVTSEDLLRAIDAEVLNLRPSRYIPLRAEKDIFGSLRLLPRLPQELRITIYKKIFYAESFQYFDAESFGDYIIPLVEYLRDYLTSERGYVGGHLVKAFIPSSYHSFAYSTIGFPIEFRVTHPLVLSLKVEPRRLLKHSAFSYAYYIRPSVYFASYYKHSVINTAVGHGYGVYQEQKYALSFPVELYVSIDSEINALEVSYKLPEVPNPVYEFYSEAGTYENKLLLGYILGVEENRRPIRTIPAMFENQQILNIPGIPSFFVNYRTEDIHEDYPQEPKSLYDAAQLIYNALRNPGLRRKAVSVAVVTDPASPIDQVTFKIRYQRFLDTYRRSQYGDRSQSEERDHEDSEDSSRSQDEDDALDNASESESSVSSRIFPRGEKSRYQYEEITSEQAFQIQEAFARDLSKAFHEISVRGETRPTPNVAELRVEYNHTFDRTIHSLRAEAKARVPEKRELYKVYLEHVQRYEESPNEYRYDPRAYVGRYASFYQAISFGEYRKPREEGDVIIRGAFVRVPSALQFSPEEFSERPGRESFTSPSQEECLKDVQEGKSQSPTCIAAVRENARLNKVYIRITARQELPRIVQDMAYEAERAINHYYYNYADVQREVNNPEGTVEAVIDYVDKLTEKPVLDVVVRKPKETVTYHKVDVDYVEPLSSVHSVLDSYLLRATNNTFPPSCGLMERYVRTYDQQVYRLPWDPCTYVLSAHCTERKKFAVLARQTSASENTKEITVYLADQKVVLTPRRAADEAYIVVYNDRPIEIRTPVLLSEENLLYVYPVNVYDERVEQILVLQAEKTGIKVEYDGRNAKVQVSYIYKGELCGLCSEFDGESTREYRGPDKCLYSDSEDFVRSSIADADTCGVPTTPKKPVLCSSDDRRSMYPQSPGGHESKRRFRHPVAEEDDLEYYTDAEDNKEKSHYPRGPRDYSQKEFYRPYSVKTMSSEESKYFYDQDNDSAERPAYYYGDRYESNENSRYPIRNEYGSYRSPYYYNYGEEYRSHSYDDQKDSAQRRHYDYGDHRDDDDDRDKLFRKTYRNGGNRNSLNFRYPDNEEYEYYKNSRDEQNNSYRRSRRPYDEKEESGEKFSYPYEDYLYRRYRSSFDENRDDLRKYSHPYKNKYETYGKYPYPNENDRNRASDNYYKDDITQKLRYYTDSSKKLYNPYDQEGSSEEYPYGEMNDSSVRGYRRSYGDTEYSSKKFRNPYGDEYNKKANYPYDDYEGQEYPYSSSRRMYNDDEDPQKYNYSYNSDYRIHKKFRYSYDDQDNYYRSNYDDVELVPEKSRYSHGKYQSNRSRPHGEQDYFYRTNFGSYGKESREKYGPRYGRRYESYRQVYKSADQDNSYQRAHRSYDEKEDYPEESSYSYDNKYQSYKKSGYPDDEQDNLYYRSQYGNYKDATKRSRYSPNTYEIYRNRQYDGQDYRKKTGPNGEKEDRREKYSNADNDRNGSYRKSYENKDFSYLTSRRNYKEGSFEKPRYSYNSQYEFYKTFLYPYDVQDYSDLRYGGRYDETEDMPEESRKLRDRYDSYRTRPYGEQDYSDKRSRRSSSADNEDKTEKYGYLYGNKDESYYHYNESQNSYRGSRRSYDEKQKSLGAADYSYKGRYGSYRKSRYPYDDQNDFNNRYRWYYDEAGEEPEESRSSQDKYESYRSRPHDQQAYLYKKYLSSYEKRQEWPEEYESEDESYERSYPYDDQYKSSQNPRSSSRDEDRTSGRRYPYDDEDDSAPKFRYSYYEQDRLNKKYESYPVPRFYRKFSKGSYDKKNYEESSYPYDQHRGLYDRTTRNYYGDKDLNENSRYQYDDTDDSYNYFTRYLNHEKYNPRAAPRYYYGKYYSPEESSYGYTEGRNYRSSRSHNDNQSYLPRRSRDFYYYEEESDRKSYDPYTSKVEAYKRSNYDKNESYRRPAYLVREGKESDKQLRFLQDDENNDEDISYTRGSSERGQHKDRRVRFQPIVPIRVPLYRNKYDEKKIAAPLDSVKNALSSALFQGRRYRMRE